MIICWIFKHKWKDINYDGTIIDVCTRCDLIKSTGTKLYDELNKEK